MIRKTTVEQPPLRRKQERHPVAAGVRVSCRGLFRDATLVDFSVGGLRLDGTFGLMVGDKVIVQLASGEELPGRVAWSLGAMVGVEFPPDHDNTDPDFLRLMKFLKGATSQVAKVDRPSKL